VEDSHQSALSIHHRLTLPIWRPRAVGGGRDCEEEIDAFLDTLPPRRYKNAASPDVKIGKNWSDNFTKQKGKR
jgi:hypothetical protein